ncbi:MAG: hypothetical protein JW837_05835 [Sedimentisphaerales bacterium]|nr:hypothetical protein [Sedimentisphaerales bacterium]
MKRVMKICLVAAILFAMPIMAYADEPFVKISMASRSLQFGEPEFSEPSVVGPGAAMFPSIFGVSSASMTLKVESNCLHGPIMASISELRHRLGKKITSDRISVKSPKTNGFVSMTKPVMISEPHSGSHNIDLDFKLEVNPFEAAGRYEGVLTFTIMPLP